MSGTCTSRKSPELRRLEAAMTEIQSLLQQLVEADSHAVTNALLNITVARLLEAEGAARASHVLGRLAWAIVDNPPPTVEAAIDLTALHG